MLVWSQLMTKSPGISSISIITSISKWIESSVPQNLRQKASLLCLHVAWRNPCHAKGTRLNVLTNQWVHHCIQIGCRHDSLQHPQHRPLLWQCWQQHHLCKVWLGMPTPAYPAHYPITVDRLFSCLLVPAQPSLYLLFYSSPIPPHTSMFGCSFPWEDGQGMILKRNAR